MCLRRTIHTGKIRDKVSPQGTQPSQRYTSYILTPNTPPDGHPFSRYICHVSSLFTCFNSPFPLKIISSGEGILRCKSIQDTHEWISRHSSTPWTWVQNEMSLCTCALLWEVPENSDARSKWLCAEFLTSGNEGRSKIKNTCHHSCIFFFLHHSQQFIPVTRLFSPLKQDSDFTCANDSLGELKKMAHSWPSP